MANRRRGGVWPGDHTDVERRAGEAALFFIVPRGVEHQPYAEEEVEVVVFEPVSTLNTGNVRNELTKDTLKRAAT